VKTVDSVDVAIVGGGPAGLTAAIELAQLGVEAVVFERRSTSSPLPRAHLLNQRTMEIFDVIGVAEDIYALCPPEDRWHRVAWYLGLAGERPGQGREIGHIHAWGGGVDRDRYSAASPKLFANVPQMRLDPLLRAHADRSCPGRIHFGHEVTALTNSSTGVDIDVFDVGTGSARTVHARYVIGADGGRTVTSAVGIKMDGLTELLDTVTMHVTADLAEWITDDQVLLSFFIDPASGLLAGGMCAMGPDTWGSQSREWAFHQTFAIGTKDTTDEEALMERFRGVIGIPDLQFDVHSISHWQLEGLLAERYRAGNVFLVGNAAHRHPPTGGLGLNTAVQDVDNLCWKLAQVLRGHAADGLLDTYEAERRPIGAFNVKHSLDNAATHNRIAAALGLQPGMSPTAAEAAIGTWLSPGPDGDERRRAVAEVIASNSDDFSQLNVEVGFAYAEGALIPDGSPPPATHCSLRDYTPSTRPGHHLPHAWVLHAGRRVSTLELVDRANLTLLIDSTHTQAWTDAVTSAALPIHVVPINSTQTPQTMWCQHRLEGQDHARRSGRRTGRRLTNVDHTVRVNAPTCNRHRSNPVKPCSATAIHTQTENPDAPQIH
jgi:2,4-dichlorophenol 6-monooxygenase